MVRGASTLDGMPDATRSMSISVLSVVMLMGCMSFTVILGEIYSFSPDFSSELGLGRLSMADLCLIFVCSDAKWRYKHDEINKIRIATIVWA